MIMDNRWFEGVVTSVYSDRVFITFKHGSTISRVNNGRHRLNLGDIVDIRVRQGKDDDCFDLMEMSNDIRRREDLIVEPFQTVKCSVYCMAEVIERSGEYFLLNTPIIGLALLFHRDAPRELKLGDVWKVKMMRRKEKKRYPSYWTVMQVMEQRPRVLTGSNRTKEREMRDSYNTTSENSSRGSYSSTPNTSQDDEWTTAIIAGSDKNLWYGSSAKADPIRIAKKMKPLNESGMELERGAFYNIKLSRARDGAMKASDIDTRPIYHRDYQVNAEKNAIEVWCYSHVVKILESAFVVCNDLLGNATLPFHQAPNRMEIGDKLETLFKRVGPSRHMYPWVVEKSVFVEQERKTEEELRVKDVPSASGQKEENGTVKDRRLLDLMKKFMEFPKVNEAFERKDGKSLKIIQQILDRDRNQ